MKRQGEAAFSKNSFYKYAALLQLKRTKPRHCHKNHAPGISANHPFQLLHINVTKFECQNHAKAFIYVIRDNCSRTILHTAASLQLSAAFMKTCLQKVYHQYILPASTPVTIMSDGGPENIGIDMMIEELENNVGLHHIIAQVDVQFSNSMAEAANYMLKY